jgi:predicted permease
MREAWGDEMEESFARLWELERARGGRMRSAAVLVAGVADVVAGGVRARLRALRRRAGRDGRQDAGRWERRASGMMAMLADVRYALRTLGRQPLFAAAAVVTLTLGIGANTAIFSLVHGLMLRPLPYPEADRLVIAWSANPERGWKRTDVSPADAWDWRAGVSSLEDLAVIDQASLSLTGTDRPERLEGRRITHNGLSIFGVEPVAGRDFTEADAQPGAPAVAIVSWGFWQRHFGGARTVVGSEIELDGDPHTVIGITPEWFLYPDDDQPAVYVPLRGDPTSYSRTNHAFNAIGRLVPGATVERASREVAQIAAALAAEHPESNRGWIAYVSGLQADLVGDVGRQASIVLMAAVVFVLLMACVNVGNLVLARGNGRQQEMAVRAALGARRGRVVRQLLTESLVIGVTGGLLGVLLAFWGARAIALALPENVPTVFRFDVDLPVLGFALIATLLATIAFGLWPAIRSSAGANLALRERAGTTGRRAHRLGGTLIVVQTALAVVLLVGGGILMRSVTAMQHQERGYDIENVLMLRITPLVARYADDDAMNAYYNAVLERVRAVPGVTAAGTIQSLPLRGSNNVNTFTVEGEPALDEGYPARMGYLSTGYLDAMRIPLLRGRAFTDADRGDAPRVALVNESLARQRFGEADVIGRGIRVDDEVWTIVGVVADMRERSVSSPPEPSIYLPVAQAPVRTRSFAIRTVADPATIAEDVQHAIWSVDADQPVYELQPMTALVRMRVGGFRLIATLMLVFAAISLVLGAVGIYGVTAYAVGRRTNEIGVRIAVGAERGKIVGMIVRQGMTRAGLGLVIGLALALGMTRALTSLLVGVGPTDPVTFGSVVALLTMVTFLGTWLPARRAARLDAVRALSAN